MHVLRTLLSVVSGALAIALLPPLTASGAADTPPASGPPAERPNVVLIIADDLGWNNVSYNDGFIKTPNIDRIARQGVQLDRFYVSPMCSPTRAGIVTGRYPMRFGMARSVVRPWANFGLPTEERTIAEAMSEAGYQSRAAFGKWHLGHLQPQWHPISQGFTQYDGCYNGAADYFTRERDGEVDWHHNWDDADPKGYTTEIITDDAVKFIQESAPKGPFFAYVAYTAPHDPLQAPERYFKQYENLDDNPSDGKYSEQQLQAAVTASLDDGVGRILKSIDDAGIANKTLIFFVSDNGGTGRIPHNNDPLRGFKLSCYEGGVRVPGAVWWPGVIEGGRKIETPIVNVDLLPTILSFCGGDASKAPAGPLDGVDVSAVLKSESGSDAVKPRDLYFFTGQQGLDHEQIAIISDDGWKLIITGPDIRRTEGFKSPQHKVELFHLSADPLEKTDLASKESARVDALGAKLLAFRKSEPQKSLPPINRKPPRFVPPPHWHNGPAADAGQKETH